jgi:hypothetical protein
MDPVTRAVTNGEDLYGLLGVSPDASDDEIRHEYRALAREHHPDANPDDARADGFRRIAAAYEILGNERDRAAYDRALSLERMAAERRVVPGPVAAHVAPRPTGAVASRGRAASPNPADHVSRASRDEPVRQRKPLDEWRLVSTMGRLLAAGVALVVIAVVALIVVSANAGEPEPDPPTIWCKTPEGWFDCWRATTPDGT